MEPIFPVSRRLPLRLNDSLVAQQPQFTEALLLCLGHVDTGSDTVCEVFHRTSEGFQFVQGHYPLEAGLCDALSDADATLTVEEFQQIYPLPAAWTSSKEMELLVVPLSVLTGPAGFLLIPRRDIHLAPGIRRLTSVLLFECLIESLDEFFSPDHLTNIGSAEQLFDHFARELAPWLAPCLYNVDGSNGNFHSSYPYITEWLDKTWPLVLNFNAHEFGRFSIEWSMLAPERSAGLHFDTAHQKATLLPLQLYFEALHLRWRQQHSSRTLPVDTDGIQGALDKVQQQLDDIKKALNINIPPPPPPPPPLAPFCFYQDTHKRWILRFRGNTVTPKSDSQPDQGMQVIRVLLQNKGTHLSALELRDKVSGYARKGQQEPDRQIDEINKNDLKRDLDLLKKDEFSVDDSPVDDQIQFWVNYLSIVKALMTYAQGKDDQLKKEYGKANRALLELGVKPQDINFVLDEYNAIIKPQKPSGNVHNTATSLQKGIYAALKTIEHASDLHGYLSKTLIVKRRAGLKPFAYRPDLYDGSDHSLRNISWETSQPAP